uniref:Ribosome-recycling factor, mitochondrial n=1 Tax=Pseudonaja textilis TaxID=8673 RepID=A0A670YH51_PSETE
TKEIKYSSNQVCKHYDIQIKINASDSSSKLLTNKLHVFYVPEEVWNFKLNTVSVEVISKFFSAGFIRVSPHMTLKTLRENFGEYLGEDAVIDKYVFLKCIGEKLVVVKGKQEMELKLKSFAPPYALHPELYLLPGTESIYSSLSSTPEKHHNNPEYLLTSASYERPHSLISPNPDIYPNSTMLDSSFKNNLSQTLEKSDFGEWNEKETLPVLHKKQKEWHIFILIFFTIVLINFCKYDKYGISSSSGNQLHKQLQHIKTERRHLENTREELIKKVKNLIERHKLRRCHVRDSWKKKYFEMKKATVFSEEALNKLQENLELHHQKLLRQLEARDINKKRNNLTQTTNSKNNIIIQITTLEREIDQLKRKLDNAKMKLVIEIKVLLVHGE